MSDRCTIKFAEKIETYDWRFGPVYDAWIILALIVGGLGGFVILYASWMYLLAKISRIPFNEAWRW